MQEIVSFLREKIIDINPVAGESEMNEELMIANIPFDSIQFILLVVAIEEKYSFEFDDEYLGGDTLTVGELVQYISSKTGK